MEIQKHPEIRFKSFSDIWLTRRLREICYYHTSSLTMNDAKKHGTFKLYDATGCIGYTTENIQETQYISIIKDGSGVGRVRILPKNSSFLATMGAIKVKDRNADLNFIYYQLQCVDFSKHILGANIPHVYFSSYGSDYYFLPCVDEQNLLGQFFQNLDQSIALQEQKLTQTQNLKQALLEKMFPKAGSKQPEIRLKGFSGDWAISQLSDFISIKHGFAFDGRYFSEMESNLCLVTPGNFLIGGGFKTEKFVYYKGTVPNNYILSDDDLIVTMTDLSKDSDTLGCPALIPKKDGKIFLHNQRIGLISFEENGLNKGFLFYLLQTNFYHKYIVLSATGTTVKHTSPDKIKSFSCHIPEYEEQVKIGQFFEKIDGVMALHKQQLQTLKNLKQAFLIKMFV